MIDHGVAGQTTALIPIPPAPVIPFFLDQDGRRRLVAVGSAGQGGLSSLEGRMAGQ